VYEPTLHARLSDLGKTYAAQLPDAPVDAYLQRLSANLSWIHTLMGRLYGDRADYESQFWGLIDDLFTSFAARPAALRTQDLTREAQADWLLSERRVGMMLYVDRFAGTLTDVADKLDYFQELGVNWLHLMPILASPPGSNDGGYAVSDYRALDPRFGTLEDLAALTTQMRARDMLLTLDLVMNHTSDQHEWARRARAGERPFQDYYYFFADRWLPDQYEQSLPEVFPTAAPGNFTYLPELKQWVMTVFHQYQWDLNYTNPAVLREMLKVLLFLANLGVDILRLDAVAFTWKRLGTTSQNLPEAHWILQLMKACAQVVAPGVGFIAEAIVAPKEVVRYFGEGEAWGHECEVAYHATLMALLWDALATTETQHLRMSLRDIPSKPDNCTWINYLRCHDDIGLGFDEQHLHALGKNPMSHKQFLVNYYSGKFPGSTATGVPFSVNPKTGDARISGSLNALVGLEQAQRSGDVAAIAQAVARIEMLHAVILAYGGLPLLYYGDEVGTPNHYAYQDDPDQAYDNRWIHRPIIDWARIERRKQAGSVEQKIYDRLRRLVYLRKASPEMADHNRVSIEDSDNGHAFAFLRWNEQGARTLVMANFHPEPQSVGLDLLYRCQLAPGQMIDKVSSEPPVMRQHRIHLPGYGVHWLTERSTFEAFQAAPEVVQLKEEGLWENHGTW
jgi:amylosucrase